MGTQVQSKTSFSGSTRDLNDEFCDRSWDLYRNDKTYGSGNGHHYDYVLMKQAVDGYTGRAKEQMRLTMLKQDSIFRHQLQELHRLYKTQQDLMNKLARKDHCHLPLQSEPSKSSHFQSQNQVIDLELPADLVDENNEGKQQVEHVWSLADLNEPINVEETSFAASDKSNARCVGGEEPRKTDFSANSNSGSWFFSKLSQQNLVENCSREGEMCKTEQPSYSLSHGKSKFYDDVYSRHSNTLQVNPRISVERLSFKPETQRKRTIFDIETSVKKHTPTSHSSNPQTGMINFDSSFALPWMKTSLGQNTSTIQHNHWLGSCSSSNQIPVAEKRLPPWLMSKPCSCSKDFKEKETKTRPYQMNLESLQNHSQQYFKKVKMADKQGFKNVKIDAFHSVTKILGVPIMDTKNLVEKEDTRDLKTMDSVQENGRNDCVSYLRHHIDLNLSLNEEESALPAPFFPQSVVKIASIEIDLEAQPVLESEADSPQLRLDVTNSDDELVKVVAEAIVSISSVHEMCQPPADTSTLMWFAEVMTSRDGLVNMDNDKDSIPEGMDYLEYMTLRLEDMKEVYCVYKPMILEEDEGVPLPKRTTKKGKRRRQRRDFQQNILPSIVSLSRREVTEDILMFEDEFAAVGVSWESSLSKRKGTGRNRKGRRHLVVEPPPSPPPSVAAVEGSVCRALALEEKSLGGWGRRTRRLPRQRCQNGGNPQSFALKC